MQGLVALVFLAAGILNLMGIMTEQLMRLGYPGHFATIIGVAFITGVICLYQTRFVFLQDWAFGAMAATLVGAAATHLLIGDPAAKAAPAIVTLAVLLVAHSLRGGPRPPRRQARPG
nr:DoxX family protein [Coralloluteibacterium stylophorae]